MSEIRYSASLMAKSLACYSFQNLLLGSKDKVANTAPTKGNNIPVVSRAPTPTPAVVLPVVSALSFVAQYLEDNF